MLVAGIARGDDSPPRPNIVFILIDDLRFDELGCTGHPFVQTPHIDRIAREGARFDNAFATTPLCSPSRGSFLTGLYAHAHGITDNVDRSEQSHRLTTFPRLLHDAGYATAYVGKWHMGVDGSPRPGFDYWVSVRGQGEYFDPELNIDGRTAPAKGYVTDLFNQHAVDFIKRPHGKPFLLYLAHKAVHPDLQQRADGSISDPSAGKFEPAKRHEHMYAGAKVPRRPNVHDTLEGKPALQRKIGDLPPLSTATGTDDETVRNRLRMLMSVEDGVGDILAALESTGQLDNTIVVFTSDHGYFYGEHGLSVERRLAYEEAIRIPLLIRYPPLIPAGSVRKQTVLSIDLAPTMLELGGAPLPARLHGRSLVGLLRDNPPQFRNAVLIEYFSDRVFPRILNMGYQAVRTDRWKYIHYTDLKGMDELYDLAADPYELQNVIATPRAASSLAEMQTTLQRLLTETP
jgi:N-acetylglucosamine-6-sulfatase